MKKFTLVSIAAMAVTFLAGCGGSSSGGGDNPQPGPSPVSNEHTVVFDLNYSGAPALEPVKVADGTTVSRPADPSRSGFVFNDWYTEAAATNAFDFTTKITSDLTLYAGWTEVVTHTVTFYLNDPASEEQEVYLAVEVVEGKLVTRPDDPTLTGYSFDGWFNTAECLEGDEFPFGARVRNDLSAYAKWTAPDWERDVVPSLRGYLGVMFDVYGVTLPEFPSSKYTATTYLDCLVLEGTEPYYEEYTALLEAAGWVLDPEGNAASLPEFGIELQYGDGKDGGFLCYLSLPCISDTEMGDKVPDAAFFAGTDQNFMPFPDFDGYFKGFNYTYKTGLQGGGNCLVTHAFFQDKPDGSTLTDAEYWVEQLKGFHALANDSGLFEAGYFQGETETGYSYVIEAYGYHCMLQISPFDESMPGLIEILAFDYMSNNYGVAESDFFGISAEKSLLGVQSATGIELEKLPEISFIDSADNLINGTNALTRYISDEGTFSILVDGFVSGAKAAYSYAFELYSLGWAVSQTAKGYQAAHYSAEEENDLVADIYVAESAEEYFGQVIEIDFHIPSAMGPEEVIAELAEYHVGNDMGEIEEGVYGLYGAYQATETNTVEALMSFVDQVFAYVLTEFTRGEEWAETEEGSGIYSTYYYNSALTIVEFYVYADVVYVDPSTGQIVPEGTEGAVSVDVIAIEAYAYTYQAAE